MSVALHSAIGSIMHSSKVYACERDVDWLKNLLRVFCCRNSLFVPCLSVCMYVHFTLTCVLQCNINRPVAELREKLCDLLGIGELPLLLYHQMHHTTCVL